MNRLGVDLGGTKIEVAVLDDAGAFVWRERVPTPQGDYPGTIEAMANLIERAERETGEHRGVGVGTPGTISPRSGLIKNANSTVLNDRPLKRDLEQRLGRTVQMANDANCLALSEARDGAAAGAQSVFGVILGTGVGGGLIVNGSLHVGHNAIAGEWGHNPLPWAAGATEVPGPACWCGLSGCIEQWLSGPAFERDYAEETGHSLTAADIVARSQSGAPQAQATQAALERYQHRLARALAHMINIVDPEVIVLGGGMSNVASLYEAVPRLWDGYVFSDPITTRLVPPVHGDSSGVRGAAFLP